MAQDMAGLISWLHATAEGLNKFDEGNTGSDQTVLAASVLVAIGRKGEDGDPEIARIVNHGGDADQVFINLELASYQLKRDKLSPSPMRIDDIVNEVAQEVFSSPPHDASHDDKG